jgi:hypothetical protein
VSAPGSLTLGEDERRVLAAWAADCAARVLPLFEARVPADARPRAAIAGAVAFAEGERRVEPLRALSAAAHAAARGAGDRAAEAAAHAAAHAAATATMGVHARGAAVYAAVAASLAAPEDPDVASTELRWAIHHLTPAARDAVRGLPPPAPSRSSLGVLLAVFHASVAGPDDAEASNAT